MLDIAILALLAVALILTLPRWRWSRGWGRLPASVIGALLLVFVVFWYIIGPLL